MKWNAVQQKLLAAARKAPLRDHVPYAFEKRVMARLGLLRPVDPRAEEATAIARAFCCAAVGCVAIALVVGAWGLGPDPDSGVPGFTHDLEQSILASVGDPDGVW